MSLAGCGDSSRETLTPQVYQPRRPALSWGVKIRRKLKPVALFLGKLRPLVGQCCHQCTPESLGRKLLHNTPSLGFQNLLCVNETHTRYRGWLVRRVCCVLFIYTRKVHHSRAGETAQQTDSTDSTDRVAMSAPCAVHNDVIKEERDGGFGGILTQTTVNPTVLRLVSWVLLKVFRLMFSSVQVNLNQLAALHRATQLNTPLVYVYVGQSVLDQALICLTLFFHNLRLPYSISPVPVQSSWSRAVLQKLGVILLPGHMTTDQQTEADTSHTTTSVLGELLCAGESVCVSVCGQSVCGGQWLAGVQQVVCVGRVPDVQLVPVSVSYDCVPHTHTQSVLWCVWSLLRGGHRGGVRIHFAQAFSLKEMCESGRCRVDGQRPLQELLMPAILHNRTDCIFGQRDVSWLLPSTCLPELSRAEREMSIALTLHLIHSVSSSMAVMSTSVVSCLILHKHHRGVRLSVLCRDVCWLLEEVLFRGTDVGFGGRLLEVVYVSVSLLRSHLLLVSLPPAGDPLLTVRPEPHARLTLSQQSHLITHVLIHEAVGACAVCAMLSEVAGVCDGGGEIDVVLGRNELMEKSLQLTHLLPVGYIPPCQMAHSFALDVVDSMVRCGILIMEEIPRDTPVCDFWRKQGVLSWRATDDPDHSSDSECEEQDTISYKLSQPVQCPDLLLFLCSLLSVQLRALCWAIESLHLLPSPLTELACVTQLHTHLRNRAQLDRVHHESSSLKLVKMVVRTLTDLGVLIQDTHSEEVYLDISPVFLQTENKQKLLHFISQFLLH